MAPLTSKPTFSSSNSASSEHTLGNRKSAEEHADQETSKTPISTKAPKSAPQAGHTGMQAPLEVSRVRFWMIFLSLMVSIFLFSLDQLIVATAIPSITEQFNSLTELPWIASGFFLTLLAFNLLYSQWLQIFPSRDVVSFAIFIFEVGSLVCGVAPTMEVLIFGRALAGVGAAGIFSGGMVIIAEITPLHNRAQYMALIGVCFAIASVLGPLVGGAFSDHITWRWCFYINLPFGGVALGMLLLSMPSTAPLGRKDSYKGYSKDMFWQVAKCDWVGCAISMAWAVCLILALQWGGITKPWNDGGVITCLVLFGVLPFVFIAYEYWIGENAMFKMALLKRRTIAGASILLFCGFAVFMLTVYYLSEGYQAVYHTTATEAGIRLLPLIMVQIVALIGSSRIIPLIGRFKYIIVAGTALLTLAAGLLYSVTVDTSEAHLYGYQAILGVGIGFFLQNSMVATQFELKSEPWLISAGTGLTVFIGFAGRVLGISLGGSVFGNMLPKNVAKSAPDLPSVYLQALVSSAQAVWNDVPEKYQQQVLVGYVDTLREVYLIGVPFGVLAFAGAMLIRNSKMQTKEEEEAAIKASREKAALAGGAPVPSGKSIEDAIDSERETAIAEGIASSGPVPEKAGDGGLDAQALVAEKEGRSAV